MWAALEKKMFLPQANNLRLFYKYFYFRFTFFAMKNDDDDVRMS